MRANAFILYFLANVDSVGGDISGDNAFKSYWHHISCTNKIVQQRMMQQQLTIMLGTRQRFGES